ncbi:hypothetical protein LFL96_09365 [Paraburkholderia sp. D15]|uniref:hypothetical protein n=1 Tax=Paraburkholderia sp. D15 TaxID=2880218 RepID=UPI00247A8747|nr:hypothetical protein [Paraburkholderia sp. D15]WGS51682.1 hypothetical protein LFL96_09365 [Paraburkholderia sp. D15]
MNVLGHRRLHRPAIVAGGASRTERTSADFLIDGQSLLEMLVESTGGHADFMGCFVTGYAKECERTSSMLIDVSAESEKRVLIYICPECGDIACGAYSVVVRRDHEAYVWESFAYQTGESDLKRLDAFGPFFFDASVYKDSVLAASAVDGTE